MSDNRVEDFDLIKNRLFAEIKANGGGLNYTVTVEKCEQVVIEQPGVHTLLKQDDEASKVFGYAPSRPAINVKKSVIFTQTVDTLVLADVVKAVNRL